MPRNKYYVYAFKITRCFLLIAQAITIIQVIISHNASPESFITLQLSLSAACLFLTVLLFLPLFRSYKRTTTLLIAIGLLGCVFQGAWSVKFPGNLVSWGWVVAALVLAGAGLLLDAEENEVTPKSRL